MEQTHGLGEGIQKTGSVPNGDKEYKAKIIWILIIEDSEVLIRIGEVRIQKINKKKKLVGT